MQRSVRVRSVRVRTSATRELAITRALCRISLNVRPVLPSGERQTRRFNLRE